MNKKYVVFMDDRDEVRKIFMDINEAMKYVYELSNKYPNEHVNIRPAAYADDFIL